MKNLSILLVIAGTVFNIASAKAQSRDSSKQQGVFARPAIEANPETPKSQKDKDNDHIIDSIRKLHANPDYGKRPVTNEPVNKTPVNKPKE